MKTTAFTIVSALASVIYWRVVEATPTKRQKQAALKIGWRWPMINSALRKCHVCSLVPKGLRKPRLWLQYYRPFERSPPNAFWWNILNRIRLGWNCFRQQPLPSSKRQKMVRPSILRWDVWVKKAAAKAVPEVPKGFPSICRSKTRFKSTTFDKYFLK